MTERAGVLSLEIPYALEVCLHGSFKAIFLQNTQDCAGSHPCIYFPSVIQLSGAEKTLYEIIIERHTPCLSVMLISCFIKNTFSPSSGTDCSA